jgi:hypothetical protein
MRRLLTGFVVAAAAAVVPALALADNQQVAEEIASRFKTSGQMSDYKIGVKYQNRMAWLHGRVASAEQMKTALRLTFKTASVDRVVNELTIAPSEVAQPAKTGLVRINVNDPGNRAAPAGYNPLREQSATPAAVAKQPQKTGFLARLEAASWRKPKTEASQPLPVREAAPARDDQAPTAKPSTIRQVAAEEPQELPAPKYARPAARVAMMQPTAHGPMAPNAAPPLPMYQPGAAPAGAARACYDQPCMPNYSWPSYAAYPNYAAVTYPKQYSPTAWPYIGPFYPYPQVPLGWRKVTLEWDSGWWYLDFKDQPASCWQR